ncbi:uncharacterized protein LOC103943702 [Pyrus x bretschneideri]|uniref:uncharacterized protein LOC103943702 n=1 Tax=Pyrus x bretschneideri TaxID=225117 RepID=UPI00202F543B|nr:uncharacterized protein LOC103943702 [Pyrus x bretschneideri]
MRHHKQDARTRLRRPSAACLSLRGAPSHLSPRLSLSPPRCSLISLAHLSLLAALSLIAALLSSLVAHVNAPSRSPPTHPSRRPESSGQLHSPPLAFEGARSSASHPYPSAGVHRSTESRSTWDDGQRSSFKNYDTQAHQRPPAVTSFIVSRNSGTSVTAKVPRFQDTKGISSPPFLSKDVNFRNSTQGARKV